MPMAEGYYVRGTQQNQMAARKWISGPFDSRMAAEDERTRITDRYPGVYLSVHSRRVKGELPVCVPRPPIDAQEHDLATPEGRKAAAEEIADLGRNLGAVVLVEFWEGAADVTLRWPNLEARLWLEPRADIVVPAVKWYGATWPLRAVPGAWGAPQPFKASSAPASWCELYRALETGACASLDGSAFDFDPTHKAYGIRRHALAAG